MSLEVAYEMITFLEYFVKSKRSAHAHTPLLCHSLSCVNFVAN